jgi:hypothetical protein
MADKITISIDTTDVEKLRDFLSECAELLAIIDDRLTTLKDKLKEV